MWKWIKLLWETLMDFFGRYKKLKTEEEAERKVHYEEIKEQNRADIEDFHEEVINSPDPNATVDSQLRSLDLVE